MKQLTTLAVFLLFTGITHQSLFAQGATQAIRGAAAGLEGNVNDSQKPLTPGPEDPQEKTKPGKIDD